MKGSLSIIAMYRWLTGPIGLLLLALPMGCRSSTDRPLAAGELRGRVMAGTTPAAGAHVLLDGSALSVSADEQGGFSFQPLGTAAYALVVTYDERGSGAPDFFQALGPIAFDPRAGLDLGTIQLTPAGALSGTVTLAGNVVPDAALQVVDGAGHAIPGIPVVLSDAAGHYAVPYAPAGVVAMQAMFTSGSQVMVATSQTVTVVHDQTTSVDLTLSAPAAAAAGTVTGKAVYADGVSKVSLLLSRAGQQDLVQSGATAAGFSVASVPPGLYALGITADGLQPVVIPYVLVNGDTDVGTAVFAKPLAGATADCASDASSSCTPGQAGCDPDESGTHPTGEEVNAACLCQPGQALRADGSCFNACSMPTVQCDLHATCLGGPGINYCTCNPPYGGDGKTCTFVPPQLNALEVRPGIIGNTPGGVVQCRFEANQLVSMDQVSVTIGGRPMSCVETGSRPWIYTCSYAMTGDEIASGTQAVQTVQATLSDDQGDMSSETAFVDFDFQLPTLTSLAVSYPSGASSAMAGSTVTITLETDRPLSMQTPPQVTAALGSERLPFSLDASSLMAQQATFTATIPSGAPAGSYQLEVVLTDSLGNVNTLEPQMPTIDVQAGGG